MSCFALVALATASSAIAASRSEARAAADNPALVSLPSVSNGCGGGVASTDSRFADEWAFGAWRVNFREACNVHDAAYSGAVVFDPFSRKVIDFRSWTQKEIDDKFLEDMRTLCRRQITGASPRMRSQMLDARNDCTHGEGRFQPSCSTFYNALPQVGGNSTIGALFAYKLVRKCGDRYYRERIDLDGHWVSADARSSIGETSITQVGRAIALSWTERTGVCGLGTGTLVTRDQDEVIEGNAIVSGYPNGEVIKGSLRILVKDGTITFTNPTPIVRSTLHKGPPRSTQAAGAKCAKPAAKPTTTTSGATFTLTNTKVTNPNAPELTINAAAGTATWDHTGPYGGAGKGGEWKVEYTFKVPRTLTAGKSASVSLALKAVLVEPVQPLSVGMSARAPDFRQDLSINYPNPAQASKTYTVPISSGYKDFKDIVIVVSVVSAEITFTYHRAGS
jgi:hypothetical protein